MSDAVQCSPGGGDQDFTGLRVGALFVILATSSFGAFFPVIAAKSKWLHIPVPVFE
jgi:zinc transporter 1/2/3